MRAAFEYFSNRDITDFDFRKFPKTKLREQVQKCSDSFEMKFYKWLFREELTLFRQKGKEVYIVTEKELYTHWKMFSMEYGSVLKRDRGYVCASFEAEFSPKTAGSSYQILKSVVDKKLDHIPVSLTQSTLR